MREKLIRLPEALEILGIKKTKFYDLIKQGKIPQPIKPSPKAAFWKNDDIYNVMNDIASGILKF